MKHLSWIVTFPVTVVAVVFAVANRTDVTLRFWPLPWSIEVPIWLLVLGSLLAGFLLGGLVAWIAAAPRRRRARQTAERARELARQLAELQRRQAAPVGTAAGAGGQAVASAPAGGQKAAHQPGQPATSGAALERLPGA